MDGAKVICFVTLNVRVLNLHGKKVNEISMATRRSSSNLDGIIFNNTNKNAIYY